MNFYTARATMSQWYYARGGQQGGPVSFETLREMARNGDLDREKDLVWTSSMKDWVPAGQAQGVFETPAAPQDAPMVEPANPYSAPKSAWEPPVEAAVALEEIVPGSDPIDVMGCVKRGFQLTSRHFGRIILVGLTYIGISLAVGFVLGMIDSAMGWGDSPEPGWRFEGANNTSVRLNESGSPLNVIVSNIFSIFLSLGAARIGLNIVSGKEFSVSMLFGQGRKLLRAIGASILFGAMVVVGLLLLIVPGIYLALRFGQFMNAIVDRDMGVLESLSYSSSITTNNRLNLFLLVLLSIGVVIAGLLALVVGLIFAYPVVWLAWVTAYRWMQYGHRAAMDQPGTQTPMLAGK